MVHADADGQPWREPEVVFENDHWTITDYRPEETFQIVSTRGFGFTVLYDEWGGFVEAIRLLQTQNEVDTDLVAAALVEGEGETQWYFNLLYTEHMVSFFADEAEWRALQEAVEAAAGYPWSEMLLRVDEQRMSDAVAEQRAWLAGRERGNGSR